MQNKEIEKKLYWLENECEPIYDDHEESIEELLQKQLNNYNSIKQYIDQLENKVKELEKENRVLKEDKEYCIKGMLDIQEIIEDIGFLDY